MGFTGEGVSDKGDRMKLFEQIIRKKLDLSEENFLNKNYKRAIWQFYCAYNISCAITGHFDRNKKRKILLYKRFVLSQDYVDSKLFKKIQRSMRNDFNVILHAFRIIEKFKQETGYEFGEYYKIGSLGILAYEYPEDG